MKKDVIYIDIEDDITAVIEKLKNSSEKIIAMVPPKGNAVLQSVVNLKLLKRAAENAGKQPVIVTNNHALTALASGLNLYVAKNLQSKPQLASSLADEMPLDEEVEVSDESTLVDSGSSVPLAGIGADGDEVELTGEELESLEAADTPVKPVDTKKKPSKNGKKIPNFDNFRKKLLIGGGIALLLIVALLFTFGRAKANIVVRAETTPVDVAFEAKFNANSANSDPEAYNLKAISQEKKQTVSQSFSATGQKDVGEKATGKVKLSKLTAAPATVPAGSKLTSSGGLVFVTNEDAVIPASTPCFPSFCAQSVNVNVAALESGTKYNGANGNLSGAPGGASASFVGSSSGGTTQVVKVVTQSDVDKAKEALNQQDTNAVKEELTKALGNDVTVLSDSFAVTFGNVVSEPGVDQQANDAKLTAEVTYSLLGVPQKDLGEALDAFVTTQMTNKDQQRVYENGIQDLKLEKIASDSKTAAYKVSTLAYYGPQFDTEKLKEETAGKKFGEVRAYLQDLPGVKGVDIKLTPFWARKLPGVNRINIKLDVDKTNRE
jgi:hypothetical protein